MSLKEKLGKVRKLGIPTVMGRFIQQAITQVLSPLFEPIFHENSYGFRPKRSAKFLQKNYVYIFSPSLM